MTSTCVIPKKECVIFIVLLMCRSGPCQHGGTCRNEVNRYTCECAAGYTGINCGTGKSGLNLTLNVLHLFVCNHEVDIIVLYYPENLQYWIYVYDDYNVNSYFWYWVSVNIKLI